MVARRRAEMKTVRMTVVEGQQVVDEKDAASSLAAAAIADPIESNGSTATEPSKEDVARAEAVAAEEEANKDFDGTELIDDPVRMYLREIGRVVDVAGFDAAMAEQKTKARAAWAPTPAPSPRRWAPAR